MQSTNSIAGSGIEYKIAKPSTQLFGFVESFWMLENTSDTAHESVGLPDGRFDLNGFVRIFSFTI